MIVRTTGNCDEEEEMKNWGIVLLVIVGFVSGIAFVYSCGGGGSGAMAAVEAHFHDEMAPGVFPIGASAFNGPLIEHGMQGRILRSSSPGGGSGWAAFTLPFRCTLVRMEARVKNLSATEEVYVDLLDGTLLYAYSNTHVPIVSLDTSSQAPSSKYFVFSTPTFAYDYDPANLEYLPLWVTAKFANHNSTGQRMHWVKVYYTVP